MIAVTNAPSARKVFLIGLTIAVAGAILFSAKAIVAKLIYRYSVDAVTLIAFRMMFAFPFFIAVAIWKARTEKPVSGKDRAQIVLLGLLGYCLSSFLDFLGLQTISAGLERLILFFDAIVRPANFSLSAKEKNYSVGVVGPRHFLHGYCDGIHSGGYASAVRMS